MSHLVPDTTQPAQPRPSHPAPFFCADSQNTELLCRRSRCSSHLSKHGERSRAKHCSSFAIPYDEALHSQATENLGKYWAGTGMYFQFCKSPLRDYIPFFYQFPAKSKTEQSLFPLLLLRSEYLLLSGDSKLGHVPAM